MASGIKIENLKKSFNSAKGVITPIDNFSLDISANELTTVIGKSGCGKTTLLKLISGIEKADEGKVIFYDKDGQEIKEPRISYVFQEARLLPWKTVGQNLELPIRHEEETIRKKQRTISNYKSKSNKNSYNTSKYKISKRKFYSKII